MSGSEYMLECVCGQLTAVDLTKQPPRCSRCNKGTFTEVMMRCAPNESTNESSKIKRRLNNKPAPDDTLDFVAAFNGDTPIEEVINRTSRLRLSRASATLDHLDMLLQSESIDAMHFAAAKRQVLDRVNQMVNNDSH